MHNFRLSPSRRAVVAVCLVLSALVVAEAALTLQSDKEALLALQRSIRANLISTWGTGDPCSDKWQGVDCSDQGHVTRLELPNLGLEGRIPAEIGNLTGLTVLTLSGNNLTGLIPPELGRLTNLTVLALSDNLLSGPIPPELASLSSLANMDLKHNNLTDSIPDLSKLSTLTNLDLSRNRLSGSIPSTLNILQFNLVKLDLSDNLLSGRIPPELNTLSALKNLNLSGNALSNSIPKALGGLASVTIFDLSRNNLSGPIPSELGQLAERSALTLLNLANNQLTNAIPPELGRLSKLTTLLLSSNRLSGPIPLELGNITSLKFDLSSNFLKGTVPQELASARVALNCLNLETGDYITNGQRDSQTCSQFYSDVVCPPCLSTEHPGTDGLCRCVIPLQLQAVFTANDAQSLENFSVNVNSTMQQLATAALLRPEQMALFNFSKSDSPPTINLRFLALPLARSSLPPDQIDVIRRSLRGTTNVTVPFFKPGFKLLPDQDSVPEKESSLDSAAKAGIAVGTLTVVMAASLAAFALRRHRQSAAQKIRDASVKLRIPDTTVKSWTFAELQEATGDFNEANRIGQGGFGSVYRGALAGVPVAVKRLESGSRQGWEEFEKELKFIGTIHSRNLVQLLGYCVHGEEQILVYEFMPNGSLQDALFDKEGKPPLSWEQCRQILLGTASAIAYLHESCSEKIIHRDIKPANILLDSDYVAKVSDFGMATSTRIADTHISTNPKGTIGYLAPEYYASGHLTEKSDVYSFGMVMLVVISNQPPWSLKEGQAINLSGKAFHLAQDGREIELLAPRFEKECDEDEARRFISVALLCIQPVFQERPSMRHVLQMMSGAMDIPPINMHAVGSFVLFGSNSIDSESFSMSNVAASTPINPTNTTDNSSPGTEE